MNEETTLTEADPSGHRPPVVAGQLLFSGEIESAVENEERAGVYTAERLLRKRKPVYDAIVQLLGADVGMLRIAKLLGVHHLTVAAVRDREPEQIDIARSKVVAQLRTAIRLQVERLIANPNSVPWNVVGLLISQLTDKAELLDGRATARTEHRETVDIHADWEQIIRERLQPAQSEKLADAREIGFIGGKSEAIGGTAAPVPQIAQDGPGDDLESVVSESDSQVEHQSATDPESDPDRSPAKTVAAELAPDARKTPGGGDANSSDPVVAPIGDGFGKFWAIGSENRDSERSPKIPPALV